MARQTVNVGATANDNTGDTLRQAGIKINDNFIELYTLLGGDSATVGVTTQLTDSGVTFFGVTYDTVLGFTEGSANVTLTLPDSSGIVVINTANQKLTNKLINLDSGNIVSGIAASSFVLSNASGQLDASVAQKAIPAGTVVGTSDIQTLTNKTLTTPTITEPKILIAIDDSNGAEMLRFVSTASAVNEVQIRNAAAGSGPIISSVGDDTNINLNLASKGTGAVRVQTKVAYSSETLNTSTAISLLVPLTIFNSGSSLSMTLANGSVTGESKKFININTGAATVTPTSFGQGTSFTVNQNGAAEAIWSGSNWFLFGDSSNYVTIT